MDPVTHTLVGVTMANAFFRKRVGPRAVPILAVASNLPDIDAAVVLSGDPASVLMRRTFGHSLLLVPIWSLLLALLFRRFYPRFRLAPLFGLVLLGAVVHLFFDLVNSFGVVLLWPLSDWRPEFGIIFIIDLALTGLLAAPLLFSLVPVLRPRLVSLSRIFVVLVALYVLFCGVDRMIAGRLLTAEAERLGIRPDFSYVFPEPLGPQRWHGVLREGDDYRVFLIRPLSGLIVKRDEVRTRTDDPRVAEARKIPLARRLEWFFKAPVWRVGDDSTQRGTTGSNSVEVSVYDLRFKSLVIDRGVPFIFRFRIDPDGKVE
ncbi:MAG TPA: metal-dependent hydrolase, partial [Nitrospiria bacterium]|nr:metal-dependent hydrolase [Nitrospiria bacterium]